MSAAVTFAQEAESSLKVLPSSSDLLWVTLTVFLAFALITALAARSRGISPVGWVLVGMLLGPIGVVVALLAGRRRGPTKHAE